MGRPSPEITRLARANPARVREDHGRSVAAQAALSAILAAEGPGSRPAIRRAGRRVLLLAFTALLLIVGAALAATDPFGIFRSPNPGTAIFRIDEARHVRPPRAQQIACPRAGGQAFRCGPSLTGRRYMLISHVQSSAARLTRGHLLASVRSARHSGSISAQTAARFEADLAAVSDRFLAHLRELMQWGTLSTSLDEREGRQRVPPPGVPAVIVCEPHAGQLRCRNLNGDGAAAIGSGIYQALPSADWRPAPARQAEPQWSAEVAILGHPPTPSELALLRDLASIATVHSSSGSASVAGEPSPSGSASVAGKPNPPTPASRHACRKSCE